MRILIISFQAVTNDGPLGMACIGLSLAEQLTAAGYEVELVVSSVGGFPTTATVRPVSAWAKYYQKGLAFCEARLGLATYRKRYVEERLFDRLCKKWIGPDVDLVISTNSFLPQTTAAARARGVPVVLMPGNPNDLVLADLVGRLAAQHGLAGHVDAYRYEPRLEMFRETLANVTHVFCYSRVIDRSFEQAIPDRARHVRPAMLKFRALSPQSFVPDQITFGYLGYTVLLKGLDVLLEAWNTVHSRSGARLVIAGPIDPAVRSQIEKHGAAGRTGVVFAQRVDDLAAFFAKCSVLVVPSHIDGQPAVAVEAMASARPVIVTSACGVADFVEDREEGIVVPPADPTALGAAMQWFIDDPRRVAACGRRARDAYDRFSFDDYIKTLSRDMVEIATHA